MLAEKDTRDKEMFFQHVILSPGLGFAFEIDQSDLLLTACDKGLLK